MAKPISLKEATKLLKKAGCVSSREREHTIYTRTDGKKFSLPSAKRQISAGVSRKLSYFLKGDSNYTRR